MHTGAGTPCREPQAPRQPPTLPGPLPPDARAPQPGAGRDPLRCPICGGEHDRPSHDAPGCFGLTTDQLRELRASAVDELVNALRNGAPADHVKDVLTVVDVVERRLAASG
jgi:hypothetical protein